MNTDPEFAQSPLRALWPFPEAPAPDQRKPEPLPFEPQWYLDAQAASAIVDDPVDDHGPEMLGGLLVALIVVGALAGAAILWAAA